jgi:BlaI family transcriptional regulator, penicillinase repressor
MLRTPPKPTEAELAILRVLWRRGPSTVRQVREVLEQDRPTGYTTALKLLQIMFGKGLVLRDESSRTHVYRARALEQQTKRHLLRDLADRAFDGSLVELVKETIAARPPTREEADEIRKLLGPSDHPTAPRRSSPAPSADDDTPGPGRLF